MTGSQSVDSQIRYILTQNRAKLEAESYTQDDFIALLSELAAATWKAQDRESAAIDVEAALASMSARARSIAFLQLCVDFGFVVRSDANTLRFRDAWLHGYLAAHGLVHLLGGEYSDRGLTRDSAAHLSWKDRKSRDSCPDRRPCLARRCHVFGRGGRTEGNRAVCRTRIDRGPAFGEPKSSPVGD